MNYNNLMHEVNSATLFDLASEQAVSVNKVIDELVTIALTERDAYLRFTARANKGDPSQALGILRSKSVD